MPVPSNLQGDSFKLKRYDGGFFRTGPVRLNFAGSLSTPKERFDPVTGEKYLSYECVILIPKDDKITLPFLRKLIKSNVKKKYPEGTPVGFKTPLKDGDAPKQAKYKGHPDHYVVNISSRFPVELYDQLGETITDPSKLYSGCWVRVLMQQAGYFYKKEGNVGFSLGLGDVQKLADDNKLTNRLSGKDAFEPIEDAAEVFADDDLEDDDVDFEGVEEDDIEEDDDIDFDDLLE